MKRLEPLRSFVYAVGLVALVMSTPAMSFYSMHFAFEFAQMIDMSMLIAAGVLIAVLWVIWHYGKSSLQRHRMRNA